MDPIEAIHFQDRPLAYLIHSQGVPTGTRFFTDPSLAQQVGLVVRAAGSGIERHCHLPVRRITIGTPEVLYLIRGRCAVEVYSPDHQLQARREARAGDVLILLEGGHAFQMYEDTVLLEVKPGPFGGDEETERF